MIRKVKALAAVCILPALLGSGCGGAAGGLVVIPPKVKKARAPEDKYKNVHAIYLYDIGYVHYDPIDIGNTYYPTYAYSRFAKIKLLTRAATEGGYYGNIVVRHLGELYDIGARILKPDGQVQELKKADFVTTILIKDVVPDIRPPIHYYETVIIYPGVDPGDIIEYNYTRRGRELVWNFNHVDAPVLFSKYMVARPPKRTEIQPVIYDRHNLSPEKATDKGMATGMMGYMSISRQATFDIWTARNVPPITEEQANPPVVDLASRIRIWQGARKWDWTTLGTTYYKWFTHYGRYPDKPQEIAAGLVKDISDTRERARVIHDWVKKNLNIQPYAELSFVPRQFEISKIDMDELLEEKNATPEKTASLMWLMFQAAGIDATLVLAVHEDYPPAIEDLPDLYQFTHPLLALPDGTLLDTTHRMCPFGMIPWSFEGRKALWIKKGSVGFKDIPASPASANRRDIQVTGTVEPDGTVKVTADFDITGQMAFAYRKHFGPLKPKEKEERVREMATYTAAKAEVDDFVFKNLDDPSRNLKIVLNYHVPSYADMMKDKMIMKLGAFLHHTACPTLVKEDGSALHICPKPMTETRANPVEFPFKRLDDMNIQIEWPRGFLLQALPKGFRTRHIEKGTALGLQTSYGSDGGKNLKAIRKLSVNEPFVAKSGYPNLRDLMRRFQAQKDTLITLDLPKLTD